MNIVFYLSEPVNLTPMYRKPIPCELIQTEKGVLFIELYQRFLEAYPNADYYVIDSGTEPVFYEIYDDLNILNLPTVNPFSQMFLFSSLLQAQNSDGFSLFVPADTLCSSLDKLFARIHDIAVHDIGASSLTFFGSYTIDGKEAFIAGNSVFEHDHMELYNTKSLIPSQNLAAQKEKQPDIRAFGNTGIFCFNGLKFADYLPETWQELNELFFMLVNSWKDARTFDTALPQAIEYLSHYHLRDLVALCEDSFITPLQADLHRIRSIHDLIRIRSNDASGNLIIGNFELDQVHHSFLFNTADIPIRLSRMDQILCIAAPDSLRIEKF